MLNKRPTSVKVTRSLDSYFLQSNWVKKIITKLPSLDSFLPESFLLNHFILFSISTSSSELIITDLLLSRCVVIDNDFTVRPFQSTSKVHNNSISLSNNLSVCFTIKTFHMDYYSTLYWYSNRSIFFIFSLRSSVGVCSPKKGTAFGNVQFFSFSAKNTKINLLIYGASYMPERFAFFALDCG